MFFCFFFFSSRRRHTRLQGDWSSDVCSSDLSRVEMRERPALQIPHGQEHRADAAGGIGKGEEIREVEPARSEERRVGKECRSRWWAEQEKKKGREGG